MGNRVDTKELVKALRICSNARKVEDCTPCPYHFRGCVGKVMGNAADRLEELEERCAWYADEIIELRGVKKEEAAG